MRNRKGFTLAELIVVIAILSVLATVGFLSLQGYAGDAEKSKLATNVRSLSRAVSVEGESSSRSPRTFSTYSGAYAVSGSLLWTALSGGVFGTPGTNYTPGIISFSSLKVAPEKFVSNETSYLLASADVPEVVSWKAKTRSYFQIAGVSKDFSYVEGNIPDGTGTTLSGIVNNPSTGTPYLPGYVAVATVPAGPSLPFSGGYLHLSSVAGATGAPAAAWAGENPSPVIRAVTYNVTATGTAVVNNFNENMKVNVMSSHMCWGGDLTEMTIEFLDAANAQVGRIRFENDGANFSGRLIIVHGATTLVNSNAAVSWSGYFWGQLTFSGGRLKFTPDGAWYGISAKDVAFDFSAVKKISVYASAKTTYSGGDCGAYATFGVVDKGF